MKFSELCKELENRGLNMPYKGTGKLGEVTNHDIIKHIAYRSLFDLGLFDANHPKRIMEYIDEVMLAYRFDNLKKEEQDKLFEDNNGWSAEEKYNGCRLVLIYSPSYGLYAFGRNRSVDDFLHTDYSDKILYNGKKGAEFCSVFGNESFILDCEAVTNGHVVTKNGEKTEKGLNAVSSIFSLNKEDSIKAQKETAPLNFMVFDWIPRVVNKTRIERRLKLEELFCGLFGKFPCFVLAPVHYNDKKAFFEKVVSEGGEGVVLKNDTSFYDFGGRHKDTCVKVKRNVHDSAGQDIDCFITGFTRSKEYDKRDLISGIKLSVFLNKKGGENIHWIATVSSMPEEIRKELTDCTACFPQLNQKYYRKVLVVNGQDISARGKRLTHARIDWNTGFREDKTCFDCKLDEAFLENQSIK